MHINDFDYNLPEELIAQFPADKRDHSRLMVVDRSTAVLSTGIFMIFSNISKQVTAWYSTIPE